MQPIQNADGHVALSARSYPVAGSTKLSAGQVVKLSGGAVVSAAEAETGAILGICAENHGGRADALNLRADGPVVRVYDAPTLIFECPAPVFTASGGSATTVTAASTAVACSTADAFNGGWLKLKEKAAGSGNTDALGTLIPVTDYAQAEGVSTFTRASGATASAGDVYYVFPPVGATGVCSLDAATHGMLVLTGAGCTKIKVVGHDHERNTLRLMAVEHALGVEN